MIFITAMTRNLVLTSTCIKNFDSVAAHLKLAFLSRKFRTLVHAQ